MCSARTRFEWNYNLHFVPNNCMGTDKKDQVKKFNLTAFITFVERFPFGQ